MRSTYHNVGPKKIGESATTASGGTRIESPEDVRHWIGQTGEKVAPRQEIIVTFIVDKAGWLRISNRRSEHVVSARGQPVRSAGEMAFASGASDVKVNWVTNQSTGYSPEPDYWPAIEAALARANITGPHRFSNAFECRRCPICSGINLIKYEVFECGSCSGPLPALWNFDADVKESS